MVLIEIYTKDDCPLCETAKKMLTEKKLTFVEHIIGKDISREEVLAKFPGVRTAPVVVADGRIVREVTEFQMLLEA